MDLLGVKASRMRVMLTNLVIMLDQGQVEAYLMVYKAAAMPLMIVPS